MNTDKSNQYVRIHLEGGGTYYERLEHVGEQVLNELDGADIDQPIALTFTLVKMTDEEFSNLPDFEGH